MNTINPVNKVISSGFVIKSRDGRYLLGKADGHHEPLCWTIFKGQQEGEETLIDTAIRELKEETGIDIISDHRLNRNISTNPIFTYSLRHKDVYVFLLVDSEGVLNSYPFSCSSYWEDNKPEISDYRWFSLEDMMAHIFPSQRSLVDKLKRMENR
jgi:8-oxo-dGTP pyrophosphatase MutT (NUDIX family)